MSGIVERERLLSVESSDRPIFIMEGDNPCRYLTGGTSFAVSPGYLRDAVLYEVTWIINGGGNNQRQVAVKVVANTLDRNDEVLSLRTPFSWVGYCIYVRFGLRQQP